MTRESHWTHKISITLIHIVMRLAELFSFPSYFGCLDFLFSSSSSSFVGRCAQTTNDVAMNENSQAFGDRVVYVFSSSRRFSFSFATHFQCDIRPQPAANSRPGWAPPLLCRLTLTVHFPVRCRPPKWITDHIYRRTGCGCGSSPTLMHPCACYHTRVSGIVK